jgi:hypothetical protein
LTLQRLVLTLTREGIEIRALYRSKGDSSPGTKARKKGDTNLTRTGLEQALEALEGRLDVVGESGFITREDSLSASASPDANKLVKGA